VIRKLYYFFHYTSKLLIKHFVEVCIGDVILKLNKLHRTETYKMAKLCNRLNYNVTTRIVTVSNHSLKGKTSTVSTDILFVPLPHVVGNGMLKVSMKTELTTATRICPPTIDKWSYSVVVTLLETRHGM
jgi:hypothetical protein